jgi:hypothetical protein
MSNKPTNCKDCGVILSAEIIAQQKCRCVECQLAFNRKKQNARKTKENLEKNKDRNDMIVCKECGWKIEQTGNLFQHIKMHGLNKETYCEKFNCDVSELSGVIYKKEQAERAKGEKNPGYRHGGRFSSLSKNFKKYDGLSDNEIEEKKAIIVEKISDSNKNNGNTPTTLLYWLNQGYDENEAKKKLSERQTTFSKDICIMKYGIEEGLKVWKERQRKWQDSLPFSNYSKVSQVFFWDIYNKLPEKYQKVCYFIELTRKEYMVKRFRLDFFIESLNINIEFLGDYWHANPKIYSEHNIINGRTAKEVWEYDKIRDIELRYYNPDMKILYVWEGDYKENPELVLKQILEIINNIIKEKDNIELLNEDIGLVKGEVK